MLLACFLPPLPAVIWKDTFCPSVSVLKPGMLIAEKCAKRSSPPPSGVMKPKPLASLNHFTVPVVICVIPVKKGLSPNTESNLKPARTTQRRCFRAETQQGAAPYRPAGDGSIHFSAGVLLSRGRTT